MIATTIEQSKRLIALGLDKGTADMMWLVLSTAKLHVLGDESISNYDRWENYPAWSLSALLEVMPKENEPDLQKSPATGQYFMYGFFDLENPTYMTKDYDSPVDAAYEMVCWLLENNLIKKGGQDD